MDKFKSPIPHWTEARYWTFIRSALRKAWSKYPAKFDVLKSRRRVKPEGVKGNHRFEYQCVSCGKWFQQRDVAVDHIIPAGALTSYEDISGFCKRLFTSTDGLQILCDNGNNSCHKKKTREERGITEQDYRVNIFLKLKATEQKDYLLSRGFNDYEVSNKEKRKEAYIKILEREE